MDTFWLRANDYSPALMIIDFIIGILSPIIFAFVFMLTKKALQILEKRLNIEINSQEWEMINNLVEEAVRSVEESSRRNIMSSSDKEELALSKIKQACKNDIEKIYQERILRTKIQACVNRLYNQERLRNESCA